MGLLEDLENESNFPIGSKQKCSVCMLLLGLPNKERNLLQSRFENKKISHTTLHKVLKNNDIHISDSVIGRHRRGVCAGVIK